MFMTLIRVNQRQIHLQEPLLKIFPRIGNVRIVDLPQKPSGRWLAQVPWWLKEFKVHFKRILWFIRLKRTFCHFPLL